MKNKRIYFFITTFLLITFFQGCNKNNISPSMAVPIPDAYKETGRSIVVNGKRLQYWMYDTYTSYKGDGTPIYHASIAYAEKLGWTVNNNYKYISPDNEITQNVKEMMIGNKSDMGVTIIENEKNSGSLILNGYDSSDGTWHTSIYTLNK